MLCLKILGIGLLKLTLQNNPNNPLKTLNLQPQHLEQIHTATWSDDRTLSLQA